jgi:hypothetical protein
VLTHSLLILITGTPEVAFTIQRSRLSRQVAHMYLRQPSCSSGRASFSYLVCYLLPFLSLLCAFSFHLARHSCSRNRCPQRPCQHRSFSISHLPPSPYLGRHSHLAAAILVTSGLPWDNSNPIAKHHSPFMRSINPRLLRSPIRCSGPSASACRLLLMLVSATELIEIRQCSHHICFP